MQNARRAVIVSQQPVTHRSADQRSLRKCSSARFAETHLTKLLGRFARLILLHPSRSILDRGRSEIDIAMCAGWMRSDPARSAIVRASFSTR